MTESQMNRGTGEVWIVDLRSSDPSGREFAKRRPAVVLSRQTGLFGEDVAIIVPMTSKTEGDRGQTTVRICPTASNGLWSTGIAVAHHVRSVDSRRLCHKVGKLDPATLKRVQAAAAVAMGFAVAVPATRPAAA